MRAAMCSNADRSSLDPIWSSPALSIRLIMRTVNSEGARSTESSKKGW